MNIRQSSMLMFSRLGNSPAMQTAGEFFPLWQYFKEKLHMEKKMKYPNYPQNAIRRRAKQKLYILQGITRLFCSPFKVIPALLLLLSISIMAWKTADVAAALIPSFPAFVPLVTCSARVFFILIITLLTLAFLYLYGKPRKAREIENDLAAIFKIPNGCFYRCPFLTARKPVKGTKAIQYTLWSRWVPLDCWNRPEAKSAILWVLNAHSNGEFTAGKQKYTVTILAAPGITPEEREAPQDPLFL